MTDKTTRDTTRERLITATLDLIDQHGEDAVRVGDVARRAGTTTGSIYWFFRDRQHLINAARADRYVRHMRTILEEIEKVGRSSNAPLDALLSGEVDLTEATRVQARRRQIRVLADALEDPALAGEIASVETNFVGLAVRTIETAQEAGLIRDDVDAFSLAIFGQAISIGLALADLSPDLMPNPSKWWKLNTLILDALRPR